MQTLSILTATVLAVIAVIHTAWGLGIWWPINDETLLARAVVGAPGILKMPAPVACFIVVAALATVVVIVLMLGRVVGAAWIPKWFVLIGGFGAAAVFLARGAVGYLPFWARLTPEAPFRTYDFWAYSPLCLLIGGAIVVLMLNFCSILIRWLTVSIRDARS